MLSYLVNLTYINLDVHDFTDGLLNNGNISVNSAELDDKLISIVRVIINYLH